MTDTLLDASILLVGLRARRNLPVSLVISCSATKSDKKGPAREVYRGPFWLSLNKAADGLPSCVSVFALSAKHALIPADKVIEPYNVSMTQDLLPGIVKRLKASTLLPEGGHTVLVGGPLYAEAWRQASMPCHLRIGGKSIGYMLGDFSRWLRGVSTSKQ